MLFELKNINKPTCLNIRLNSVSERKLIICIYDSLKQNTVFCFREFFLQKQGDCNINLPVFAQNMDVLIYDFENVNLTDFVVNLSLSEITNKTPIIIDEFTESFIKVAIDFSLLCGTSKPCLYERLGFEIHFLARIEDSETPCRIESDLSFIQVSKEKFDKTSVPSRICLLLHEYSHNWLSDNADDEFEADKKALLIYRSLNLPRIEAVYAFSMIFDDNNTERMNEIIDFLDIIYKNE